MSLGTGIDLDALETATRTAALKAGAKALQDTLNADHSDESPMVCPAGHPAAYKGRRGKTFTSMLGDLALDRAYYYCADCQTGWFPRDATWGLDAHLTPGAQRLVAFQAQKEAYIPTHDTLRIIGGIHIPAKCVERSAEATGENILGQRQESDRLHLEQAETQGPMAKNIEILYAQIDGTGVPVVPSEVAGRKGKQPDGNAKTREAKMAAFFIQTALDNDGNPIRDPNSTTYIGGICNAEEFQPQVTAEALRRGAQRAKHIVCVGDGAIWIWSLVAAVFAAFGKVIEIVDFYHASEHLHELLLALHPEKGEFYEQRKKRWVQWLWEGRSKTYSMKPGAWPGLDGKGAKNWQRKSITLTKTKRVCVMESFGPKATSSAAVSSKDAANR